MKRIHLIAAGVLFMGLGACKKSFIELTPVDSYTANNYYKTEAQFQAAIVATYAPLRDVLVNDYFTSEMHSDNTIYQQYADQVDHNAPAHHAKRIRDLFTKWQF